MTPRNLSVWLVAMAAACSPEGASTPAPEPSLDLNPSDVLPIVAEFSIYKAMGELCVMDRRDYLSPLLAELEQGKASAELMKQVDHVVAETRSTVEVEEPEYVCTPEMIESSTARAAEAQERWRQLRNSP